MVLNVSNNAPKSVSFHHVFIFSTIVSHIFFNQACHFSFVNNSSNPPAARNSPSFPNVDKKSIKVPIPFERTFVIGLTAAFPNSINLDALPSRLAIANVLAAMLDIVPKVFPTNPNEAFIPSNVD